MASYLSVSILLLICLASVELGASRKILVAPNLRKILIIGATGQAGSGMVKEALSRDGSIQRGIPPGQGGGGRRPLSRIQVKAFSRNTSKLPDDVKDRVERVAGDVQNYDDVLKAVKGVDAVIYAISPRSLHDDTKYMTRGLQNVLKAMKAEGVEVINVLISVFSIMPIEEVPEMFRIEVNDQLAMHEALVNSDLKYIASCPPNFVQPPSDAYELKDGGMPGGKIYNGGLNVISLNQLSKYFIDVLTQPEHYRQIVGVRNKPTVQHTEPRKAGVKH